MIGLTGIGDPLVPLPLCAHWSRDAIPSKKTKKKNNATQPYGRVMPFAVRGLCLAEASVAICGGTHHGPRPVERSAPVCFASGSAAH